MTVKNITSMSNGLAYIGFDEPNEYTSTNNQFGIPVHYIIFPLTLEGVRNRKTGNIEKINDEVLEAIKAYPLTEISNPFGGDNFIARFKTYIANYHLLNIEEQSVQQQKQQKIETLQAELDALKRLNASEETISKVEFKLALLK